MPEVRRHRHTKTAGPDSDAKILLNAVSVWPDQLFARQEGLRSEPKYPAMAQVALQDHFARMLQIPGAKLKPASLKPVGVHHTSAKHYSRIFAPKLPVYDIKLTSPPGCQSNTCTEAWIGQSSSTSIK